MGISGQRIPQVHQKWGIRSGETVLVESVCVAHIRPPYVGCHLVVGETYNLDREVGAAFLKLLRKFADFRDKGPVLAPVRGKAGVAELLHVLFLGREVILCV